MPWRDYERLLSKVAKLYYNEEKSQREIAESLHLSTSKVCRMLSEAKTNGIIQIVVKKPIWVCDDLEEKFEKLFDLKEAIIVNDDGEEDESSKLTSIGQAGADFIRRIVTKNDIIGISWGQTLLNLVNQMAPHETEGVKVVQLVGGLNNGKQNVQAADLTRRLGNILSGEAHLLHCPGVVTGPQVKEGLLEDESIKNVFELGKKSTIAILGLGSVHPHSELFASSTLSTYWYNKLLEMGAVGDICMRYYNKDGSPCCEELDSLIMGMSIKNLKNIKTVVCIAQGASKASSILGALRGGIPDILITNKSTANKILEIC